MSELLSWIGELYRLNHEQALAAIADLGDEAFRWRPARSNSIAFNLWHLARWADRLQSLLPAMAPELGERLGSRPQLWRSEGLARRWDFPAHLGFDETGMQMEEPDAAHLPLPTREDLVAYARRAFAAAEEAIAAVRDDDLGRPAAAAPSAGTIGWWLIGYQRHEARHLGMIEALKGAQGLRGTATV